MGRGNTIIVVAAVFQRAAAISHEHVTTFLGPHTPTITVSSFNNR